MVWLIRFAAYAISGTVLWQVIADPATAITGHRLLLDQEQGWIFGVCSGIANYAQVDVSIVRLLFIALACLRGIGLAVYLIAFLIIPSS